MIENPTKEEVMSDAVWKASEAIQSFIHFVKEDLDILKGESYQRHDPDFYDEREYYNWFHQSMPEGLILSAPYKVFIKCYQEEGKSLHESVSAFIKEAEEKIYVNK
jgi:hypothetical protein